MDFVVGDASFREWIIRIDVEFVVSVIEHSENFEVAMNGQFEIDLLKYSKKYKTVRNIKKKKGCFS